MLEGRLGIAVTFAQVAGTPIATLRIHREDGEENHALLSSGESFVVSVDGTRFRISVVQLHVDLEKAIVQVDELID